MVEVADFCIGTVGCIGDAFIPIARFRANVHTACWRSITFKIDGKLIEVELQPDMMYSRHLEEASDVETFVNMLGVKP